MRLTARDVSYTYPRGDHQVLAGASFDIPAGTSAAIVGPSGSGKTTLLSLMGHLLPMQKGSIAAVDDAGVERPLSDTASWVLQTVSLLPDRTAADNVAVGAYSDGADRAEARVRAVETLRAVGLAGHESDARTSSTVLDAMIGAHGQRTVVIVTHDPEVAERCDLVLELRDGVIHERGRL